jgi:hypothetical protein
MSDDQIALLAQFANEQALRTYVLSNGSFPTYEMDADVRRRIDKYTDAIQQVNNIDFH